MKCEICGKKIDDFEEIMSFQTDDGLYHKCCESCYSKNLN